MHLQYLNIFTFNLRLAIISFGYSFDHHHVEKYKVQKKENAKEEASFHNQPSKIQ